MALVRGLRGVGRTSVLGVVYVVAQRGVTEKGAKEAGKPLGGQYRRSTVPIIRAECPRSAAFACALCVLDFGDPLFADCSQVMTDHLCHGVPEQEG